MKSVCVRKGSKVFCFVLVDASCKVFVELLVLEVFLRLLEGGVFCVEFEHLAAGHARLNFGLLGVLVLAVLDQRINERGPLRAVDDLVVCRVLRVVLLDLEAVVPQVSVDLLTRVPHHLP